MSRSRRHAPVLQMCSRSQKEWRQEYNRCLRHRNKVRIKLGQEPLGVRDVSDIWTSPSDGWVAYWDEWSERKRVYFWYGGISSRDTPEEAARLKRRVFNK